MDFEVNSEGFLLPVLPLRDVVVYPNMVLPLFVGRQRSIEALDIAMNGSLEREKKILLVAQKNPLVDEPSDQDLFSVGTVAQILQMLKLPDGTVKVLIEGQTRAQVTEMKDVVTHLIARVQDISPVFVDEREADVLSRSLGSQFEQYVKFSKKVPPEILTSVMGLEDASLLVDTIATHLPLKMDEKQKILEILDVRERIEYVLGLLESEIDLLQIEKRIRGRVKKQMEKSQREYYLNEQLKAIQKELGDLDESRNEVDILEKRIKDSGMSKEALTKASAEITKLRMMSPMSAEATVVRGYIEWLVNLPWKKKTRLHYDMVESQNLLDNEHYGLKEVKERILEYLAVQARVKKIKGPVLCLVGPPGVGKTSLAQSIASATHRQYARIALGGVRDEAEIRGHRRTYIGSMPGKIVQKLAKVGVRNPLILLDEIDKMSSDMRGDPASALLEVLDPEQNEAFGDHYLEVDYDLSDVMFICTANSMNIPAPLLDRMEIIRIPGYTEDEKLAISKQYLIPKQIKRNGVRDNELTFDELAIRDLIRYYTKEAGVRGLEREIA
ncbi:MAG: endopeptidase La, partial [Pseudomonadota bacterium]